MKAETAAELYDLLEANSVHVWIDGGWGVDALLGRQTRPHGDLDIALLQSDLPKLRSVLDACGYYEKGEDYATPWNYVLTDDHGHEVDLHAIVLDEHGNGILGPRERNAVYPAHSLTGKGVINGREVNCIAVEDLIAFHSGYELDKDDCRDVVALCEHFDIEVPAEVEAARTRLHAQS